MAVFVHSNTTHGPSLNKWQQSRADEKFYQTRYTQNVGIDKIIRKPENGKRFLYTSHFLFGSPVY